MNIQWNNIITCEGSFGEDLHHKFLAFAVHFPPKTLSRPRPASFVALKQLGEKEMRI